jgi:glycosyltransferase involved in cell wall biosynthesis
MATLFGEFGENNRDVRNIRNSGRMDPGCATINHTKVDCSMARTPMVSVCIASYNHARFLPATLESFLGQTFRDFEIIVVDDGSTDDSLEILESYARKYHEIMRVFTHSGRRNLGISVTFNVAIKEARGVYWCTHGSDDVSYPDRLERQVAFLESHPDVGWVYGVADLMTKEGAPLRLLESDPVVGWMCRLADSIAKVERPLQGQFKGQFGWDLSAFPNLVERLMFGNAIAALTTMVRRKCVIEVGPFEPGLIYSDWEFWVRLAARYRPAFLPGAVAKYRIHDHNVSLNVPGPENLRRGLEVFTTLRRKADTVGGEVGRPRMKALLELCRANYLFALGDDESARSAAATAFETDPELRNDLGQLAHYLSQFNSQPLALAMIRELGSPPFWLGNRALRRAVLRLGVYPYLRARMARMFLWKLAKKLRDTTRKWRSYSSPANT